MEQTILIVMCVALALVVLTALICETVRLVSGRRALREEVARYNRKPPRVFVVKQNAGEVRFAYIATPDENYVPREPVPASEAEPLPQPVKETVPELAEEPVQEGVIIPRTEKLTFAEKYERLAEEDKKLLDEFTAYVVEKPDCEKILQTSALTFKYKKGQIAKAIIRRESVVLNFAIVNPELERMKMKGVKMKPVEIRLLGEDDLAFAKQTADITIAYLQGEEEYRLEKRKEARREAARQRRAEAEEAAVSETTEGEDKE